MTEITLRETIERAWDENVRYHTELDGESDRAAAILAAAYFEDRLRDAIMTKFVDLNRKFRDKIFKGYGPLSTFSAKGDIAYALGLYDQKTRKGLHTVRKIRNRFAHASKPIEFDHDDLAAICRNLDPEAIPDPDTLRNRYVTYLKEVEKKILNPTESL